MDAIILARIQFALTIGFHYIFPPISIGLAWLIFIILSLHLKTGNVAYKIMARFWIRVMALVFVAGVATGITMEFQFGTNWANYSKFVGDIFGAPLAAEGVFAFFLESTFLGLLIFGEKRISDKMYWFSALMVAVGTLLSGFWIIVANSWQQTPAGFELLENKVILTDFWAAVFNPSTIPRFMHTINSALMTGGFFMLGISAFYVLKGRHKEFARKSLTISLWFAFITSVIHIPIGHFHAVQVTHTQPVKLAAFEGHFETKDHAPFIIFGIPDVEKRKTHYAVYLPDLLSILVGGVALTEVKGLNDYPKEEWPPVLLSFASFHSMVGLGMLMLSISILGIFLFLKKQVFNTQAFWPKLFLRLAIFAVPLPILANELGWMAAEVGRQPWVVQGILKTSDGVSPFVTSGEILFSIIVFSLLYAGLFVAWLYLLRRKILTGPEVIPS